MHVSDKIYNGEVQLHRTIATTAGAAPERLPRLQQA
jgi:hypothetical protein